MSQFAVFAIDVQTVWRRVTKYDMITQQEGNL